MSMFRELRSPPSSEEVLALGIAELNGVGLKQLIMAAASFLEANKAGVDALNVFPVPDGDTGTNMYLTMVSATREVGTQSDQSLGKIAEAVSVGSLMGARGNSGVILSQLLRGFARQIDSREKISPRELAAAMQAGVETAYKAVMKPVEGTILTVSKEMARGANNAARQGYDILGTLEAAFREGEKALERTPDLLPVLKQAGVVDAGGKGLMVLLEGAIRSLRQEGPVLTAVREPLPVETKVTGGEPAALEYLYCTEFIIEGKSIPLEKIRQDLGSLGDCLLVVGDDGISKVHIHTNHPGQVLERCLVYGTLHRIQVNNMSDQHQDMVSPTAMTDAQERGAEVAADLMGKNLTGQLLPGENPQEIGIVAVAAGEGLEKILRSLGVDIIVQGGQTMNPSTEEIVSAIARVPSRRVLVLPNNKNIIMAAEQASQLTDKQVAVIPSRTLTQGIAALLAFDPDNEFEVNVDRMKDSITRVKCGEVTYAVRDSRIGDTEIHQGDILGISNGEISNVGRELEQVVFRLLDEMIGPEDSLITFYYGEDVQEGEAESLGRKVQEMFPELEIEMHYGAQPLYYYFISVE